MLTYLVRYSLKGADRRLDLKPAHLQYLKKLYDSNILLAAGVFPDKPGGYLLFGTLSLEEVKSIVEQDPYIIHDARHFEIEAWDMTPFPLKNLN